MKLFVLFALVLLTACQNKVRDESFISLKGKAVERLPVAKAPIQARPSQFCSYETPGEGQPHSVCAPVDRVFFDTAKYDISPDGRDVCAHYQQYYQSNRQGQLVVDGHCDERGSRDYNMGLGKRRAAAVKDALVDAGIPSHKISVRSFGKEKPLVWGSTPEAWAKNRVAIIRHLG